MMPLCSTRDPHLTTTFVAAAQSSLAPDGGLWIPAALTAWPDIDALLALDFLPRSVEILDRLLHGELERPVLGRAVARAFDFPVPVVPAGGHLALELFHGPSLAFKDFGARLLARVLDAEGAPRTILTATSGDTGAAVAHAFHGLPGFRVAVLYPAGRVSPLQERQFATLGGNVAAFAVDGSFDDCQRLVKAAFSDPALSDSARLASANSINIVRLLAQVTYYFEAVARVPRDHRGGVVVSVPSGNFGNLCAGLIARRCGLPLRALVAATNANTTVPEYLDTGRYRPRESVQTLSNAMDVGAPSNWERIDAMYGHRLDALRSALRWGWRTDEATRDAIRALAAAGYVADPHTAVAWSVLDAVLDPGETGVFLATAHPAKFVEVLESLDIRIEQPDALRAAAERNLAARRLPNDSAALAHALVELASSGESPD